MHLTVNNIRLHVNEQPGDGPALIFLHYWGGSSRTWRTVIDALPAGHHTIAPDLRGWGDSGAAENNAYALTDFAADIEHLIAAMEVQQYILIAIPWAARSPSCWHRVSRKVCWDWCWSPLRRRRR